MNDSRTDKLWDDALRVYAEAGNLDLSQLREAAKAVASGITTARLADQQNANYAAARREHARLVAAEEERDRLRGIIDRLWALAERWKYTGDRKEGPLQELLGMLAPDSREVK